MCFRMRPVICHSPFLMGGHSANPFRAQGHVYFRPDRSLFGLVAVIKFNDNNNSEETDYEQAFTN